MENRIFISPYGYSVSTREMEDIFEKAGAPLETIFRRLEFNEVIQYTKGIGVDIGCGLSKIHSCAIGIDVRLGKKDFGYAYGANIGCPTNKEYLELPWFADESLDFIFSSHCLEHFVDPVKSVKDMRRTLKTGGHLIVLLPDDRYYPRIGEKGANLDHKMNYSPESLVTIVKQVGNWEVIQLDTVHSKLDGILLTKRDKIIADHYGHKSFNFSFEGVFRKTADISSS
jgi:SAM-dependent methyltransferase